MKASIHYILPALFILSMCVSCNLTERAFQSQQKMNKKAGFKKEVFQNEHVKLSYSIGGQGEALMFIHGFAANGDATWDRQMRSFSKKYRVIVPDLLWFGESTSHHTATLHTQAEALIALIDLLGIEKINLVGTSYGGFVCFELYRLISNRIHSVVIVDSPGPVYNLHYLDELIKKNEVESVADIFVPETTKELQRFFNLILYRNIKFPNWVLKDLYKKFWAENHTEQRALLAELPHKKAKFQEFDAYKSSDFLVVWGKYDEVFPLQSGIELQEFLHCRMLVIKRAGHAVNVEKARKFNREVFRFLERNGV